MKKKRRQDKPDKSKITVKKRSARNLESPLDFFTGPAWHHRQLKTLAPQIGQAVEQLCINRMTCKPMALPSEKLLHDLLHALHAFRAISRRGPNASLMNLAAEADEMWESLRLCKRITRLASNLAPLMTTFTKSPFETLDLRQPKSPFRTRLRALLKNKVLAQAQDLEKLIPLLPEERRKHFEIMQKNAATPPARIALARECAITLREQFEKCTEQRRLANPLFHFFLELNDRRLLQTAGFVSEDDDQKLMAFRKRRKARERQRRHRNEQKAPAQA